MKRSNRLILLVGVLLAVVAFGGIYLMFSGQQNQQTVEPTTANTVFAGRDIPAGTQITEDMLREEVIDLTNRADTAFADPSLVVGRVVRRNVVTGAQLSETDFQTGEELQLPVPPGLRAIAVQVDQVSGVGTLINPGDYVDLVVGFTGEKFPVITLDPESEDPSQFTVLSGINQTTVKVLVPGVQVLGTLVPPPVAGAEPAPGATPAPALTGRQQIVIVAVSAQQTEIIRFSQMDGTITLVLRSAQDFRDPEGNPIVPADPETSGIILRTLVEEYGVLVPELIETILPAQAAPGTSPNP